MHKLIAAAVLALAAVSAHAAEDFAWPGGHRAAVALGYDDALPSQLDIAIPALDRHGFKATFYLKLSAATLGTRLADWRRAAADGHELGNHTLFHQCSGSLPGHEWVEAHQDLDTTSAAQMADQVAVADAMLAAIDGRHERTFTVPCGDVLARGTNYVAQVAPRFVAVRLGEAPPPVTMAGIDPAAVAVIVPVGVTGAELIAMAEQARDHGTMANFTFHGIGGDYLTVSAAAHEELLDYLAAHPDDYWVAPFIDVMRHVRAEQARNGNSTSALRATETPDSE